MQQKQEMENKQYFDNSERSKLVKILPVSLSVLLLAAVFISLNGCSSPPQAEKYKDVKEAQIAFKSDAELVAHYQNNRVEYQQVIQQIKEINQLKAQLKKETDEIQRQLKSNNEDNRNNETLRKSNEEKLRAEWGKIGDSFSKAYKKKYQEVNDIVKKLGHQGYDPYHEDSKIILDRSFKYDDTKQNDGYHISKGFVLFDENTQPDSRFVVDNIDNFHDSGNIVATFKKIESKFPRTTPFGGKIYLLVEGNLYIYLNAWEASLSSPGHREDAGPL